MPAIAIVLFVICGSGATPGSADLHRIVERHVRAHLAEHADSICVELRSMPDDVNDPAASSAVIVPREDETVTRGSITLALDVTTGRGEVKRSFVSVRIRTFDSVLVARRDFDRHTDLDASTVRRTWRETTSLPPGCLRDTAQVVSRRTTRLVKNNAILFERMIEPIPTVRQNTEVLLIVIRKGITLSVQGVALEDGRIGECIAVRRVGTRTRIVARVLDERTVGMVTE